MTSFFTSGHKIILRSLTTHNNTDDILIVNSRATSRLPDSLMGLDVHLISMSKLDYLSINDEVSGTSML